MDTETVQRTKVFRIADGMFGPVWKPDHIDHRRVRWPKPWKKPGRLEPGPTPRAAGRHDGLAGGSSQPSVTAYGSLDGAGP